MRLVAESQVMKRDPSKYDVIQITLTFRQIALVPRKFDKITEGSAAKAEQVSMAKKAVVADAPMPANDILEKAKTMGVSYPTNLPRIPGSVGYTLPVVP